MKRIYNYILLAVMACAIVSCNNEELTPENSSAVSGDEVQFGLSLGNPETKTVYGGETNNAFPIYWVNGDKVQIFSPQCLEGRRSAEYKVTVSGTEQKFADQLTKTGDAGVQWSNWGDNTDELYSFYSLYPSGNYTLSQNGDKAENIVINYSQNIVVNDGNVNSDMEDCLMYAKTEGVTKGATVNLTYDPISTVIYVTLRVAKGTGTSSTKNEYTIQSISLVADQNIAGTFSLNIKDGSFFSFAEEKASTTIMAQISNPATGGFHTITNGQSLSIPLFLAPIPDLNVKNWKIQVVANNTTYTKTLNLDKILNPGMIHKITLPELSATSSEWTTGNWMENIPRNVYLSEVSIPGSWNTINTDYQSKTSISDQYAIGVRGFHLDTRWRTSDTSVGITGNLTGTINGLSVAGGAASGKFNGGDRVVSGNAKTFAEYLKDVTDNIVDTNGVPKEEYMVVMCTFAQDSYDYTDSEGDNWVAEISDACASNAYVYDSKNITENTLVGDVLGKVIVIVNLEGAVTSVPSDSKCLFVNMPLTLNSNLFGNTLNENNSGPIYKGTTGSTKPTNSNIDMYHTHAQISIAGEKYEEDYQRDDVMSRGFAPTYGERRTVANNILNWSRANYGTENYEHDKWIYLGLGGYYAHLTTSWLTGAYNGWDETDDSNLTVANDFNTWIDGKVTEMGTTLEGQSVNVPYYPVGIVLMNFVNNYASTVKKILLLNNKYRLQFDPNKPSDYNPGAKAKSAAPSYSSGMNDSDVAAFGWD